MFSFIESCQGLVALHSNRNSKTPTILPVEKEEELRFLRDAVDSVFKDGCWIKGPELAFLADSKMETRPFWNDVPPTSVSSWILGTGSELLIYPGQKWNSQISLCLLQLGSGWFYQQLEISVSKYQNQQLVILSIILGTWISLPSLKPTGSIQGPAFTSERHHPATSYF